MWFIILLFISWKTFFTIKYFWRVSWNLYSKRSKARVQCQMTEAVALQSQVFFKKVFLKTLWISQENSCVGVSFQKSCNFIKKRLQHSYFPMKFAILLRLPFFTYYFQRLLLKWRCSSVFLCINKFHQVSGGISYGGSLLPKTVTIFQKSFITHVWFISLFAIFTVESDYTAWRPNFFVFKWTSTFA